MVAGLVGDVTVAAARAGVGTARVAIAKCERTQGFGTRKPDDDVLYGFQGEGVTSIDVGKKFLVSLLVARCVREVEAHEGDEGEDVRNRQMWHVAKLRHAGVDGRYVVRTGGRGVILETETRLEATGKELVRNGGTCEGVQEKDFGPGSGVTVIRAWFDFRKHPVKRGKSFGLLLEELPGPTAGVRLPRLCCS
jgi:hypothetical protein